MEVDGASEQAGKFTNKNKKRHEQRVHSCDQQRLLAKLTGQNVEQRRREACQLSCHEAHAVSTLGPRSA